MPRNVRNFWLKSDIDGRQSRLTGGPRSKDGGFDLTVYVRDNSKVREALNILGRVYDGKVHLTVQDSKGNVVFEQITDR